MRIAVKLTNGARLDPPYNNQILAGRQFANQRREHRTGLHGAYCRIELHRVGVDEPDLRKGYKVLR